MDGETIGSVRTPPGGEVLLCNEGHAEPFSVEVFILMLELKVLAEQVHLQLL